MIPRDIPFLEQDVAYPEAVQIVEECLDLANRRNPGDMSVSLSQAGRPVDWAKIDAIDNLLGADGETVRNSSARLLRDDKVVYEGRIGSLRRGKDDVRSVASGFECGIKLENFDDIKQGDIIEVFRTESVASTLS